MPQATQTQPTQPNLKGPGIPAQSPAPLEKLRGAPETLPPVVSLADHLVTVGVPDDRLRAAELSCQRCLDPDCSLSGAACLSHSLTYALDRVSAVPDPTLTEVERSALIASLAGAAADALVTAAAVLRNYPETLRALRSAPPGQITAARAECDEVKLTFKRALVRVGRAIAASRAPITARW
jgi:hypothetical protein